MTDEAPFDDAQRAPSTQDIDRVLAFLPAFEDGSKRWYEIENAEDGEVSMDPYRYSEELVKFTSVLHDAHCVVPFAWDEWQSVAERYVHDPRLLEGASLTTLRKLLTTHVRKDRYTSGHLAAMIDRGHVLGVLRRLKSLREKMPVSVERAPAWNDARLNVASDSRRRARYRALQSWYRETVLSLPPGTNLNGAMVASLLPSPEHGLNFLDPVVARYVDERIPEVHAAHGSLDEDRLRRNMLSSMPLCFNLFGYLRAHRAAAAAALGKLLDLDVATIDDITVEWAPPAKDHLRDRTAFDAFIAYRDRHQRKCFLAVETKYTEPFSEREYDTDVYRARTTPEWGFHEGAADNLRQKDTNQLWRNVMLAMSVRRGESYHAGHVVVLACEGDEGADKAVAGLRAELITPDEHLRTLALEKLIAALDAGETAAFAQAFRKRYLDLSVLNGKH